MVFGRVKLISEGRPLDLGWRWFQFPPRERVSVSLTVVHEDRSTASFDQVSSDGFLYWHLPEGRFTITEFVWSWHRHETPRVSRRPVGARFEVPAKSWIGYIGTLTIGSEGGLFVVRVEDEYEQAVVALKQRFPEIQRDPQKSLMRLERR